MGHYDELPVSLETDKKARTISVIFRFFSKVIKYVFERVVWLFSQFWHEYLISLAPCWWAKPGDDRPNEQPQSTL